MIVVVEDSYILEIIRKKKEKLDGIVCCRKISMLHIRALILMKLLVDRSRKKKERKRKFLILIIRDCKSGIMRL